MSNPQDRRASERSFGQWTVSMRFVDREKPEKVLDSVPGKLADASFTGCRVLCAPLAPDVVQRLRSGEWEVVITTHAPSGEELVVAGRVKWLDEKNTTTSVGVQYLSKEAQQPRLAELLHAQSAKPSRAIGAAIAAALIVLVSMFGWWWTTRQPTQSTATIAPPVQATPLNNHTTHHSTDLTVKPPPSSDMQPITEETVAATTKGVDIDGDVVRYHVQLSKPLPDVSVVRTVLVDAQGQPVLGCSRLVRMEFDEVEITQACQPDAPYTPPLQVKTYYSDGYQYGVIKGQPRPTKSNEPPRQYDK